MTAWQQYLCNLRSPVAPRALAIWSRLRELAPGLPEPTQAGAFDLVDSVVAFEMVWDVGGVHADIQILVDGSVEWFVRDRRDGDAYGGELAICAKCHGRGVIHHGHPLKPGVIMQSAPCDCVAEAADGPGASGAV